MAKKEPLLKDDGADAGAGGAPEGANPFDVLTPDECAGLEAAAQAAVDTGELELPEAAPDDGAAPPEGEDAGGDEPPPSSEAGASGPNIQDFATQADEGAKDAADAAD